jgi:hypothetical protein
MNAKLPEDAVPVSDGGLEGDSELCRNLFARETRDEESHDIHFAIGESKHVCRAGRTGVDHKFSPFQAQRSGLSWDYCIQYTAYRPE